MGSTVVAGGLGVGETDAAAVVGMAIWFDNCLLSVQPNYWLHVALKWVSAKEEIENENENEKKTIATKTTTI